jgi:hypothetical protein
MPPGTKSVFLTTCPGFTLFTQSHSHVEYFPSDIHSNVPEDIWNSWLSIRLFQLVNRYSVHTVVIDTNVPFPAILDLRKKFPHIRLCWVRRGMWGSHPEDLRRVRLQEYFDLLIEPADLAESYDRGPTVEYRRSVLRVNPIRLCEDDEVLDRKSACSSLGLAPNRINVCIQLGAEITSSTTEVAAGICRWLEESGVADPIWVKSPIAADRPALEAIFSTARIFPLSKYLAAFDIAISAAGYNTFHELMNAGTPTIFLPNTAPGMDNQWARAKFASDAGWAESAEVTLPSVLEKLYPLLDTEKRRSMIKRMNSSRAENGAAAAANAILGLKTTS